jgi:phosphate acetyltransferase
MGLRVRFYKPIAQASGVNPTRDVGASSQKERSSHFIRELTNLNPPDPLDFHHVEVLLSEGKSSHLMSEIIETFNQIKDNAEVVVVEGLVTRSSEPYADTLNAEIVQTLDAEVILVASMGKGDVGQLEERIELTAQLYGGIEDAKLLGCIVNKLNAPVQLSALGSILPELPRALGEQVTAESLLERCDMFSSTFKLVGAVPWQSNLVSPRTKDLANFLDAEVLIAGDMDKRRVDDVVLCARGLANMLEVLRPNTLIITPGDRDDIITAACLAALNGVPLAGLLLTSGYPPDDRVLKLCADAFDTGLPLLLVETDSYLTASMTSRLNLEVPVDDLARIGNAMDTVAEHLDKDWLKARCATDLEPRLSPPAFLYRLASQARSAGKRIVLPEGDEPRTVRAAADCAKRGIAHCVLIGSQESISRVAETQGVSLEGIEVIEPRPDLIAKYVPTLVDLRQHKGMTNALAAEALEDRVVLGTVMLYLDEVDGLVSGAVHTTANTVRPALQLIKTHPDAKLVSSIFFMCLPEQVLVYGDCAINPDPTAEELADIAIQSADSAAAFGINPRVAMISYSTGSSGAGADVDKVRQATELAKTRRPDILIDGPLQYDAASVESVARSKAPDSPVAGRATVLIFPDLNTGNTTYKAVQRSAHVISIGPMLQGLRKPVNDLSRGALVDDITYTIALTAIQAART